MSMMVCIPSMHILAQGRIWDMGHHALNISDHKKESDLLRKKNQVTAPRLPVTKKMEEIDKKLEDMDKEINNAFSKLVNSAASLGYVEGIYQESKDIVETQNKIWEVARESGSPSIILFASVCNNKAAGRAKKLVEYMGTYVVAGGAILTMEAGQRLEVLMMVKKELKLIKNEMMSALSKLKAAEQVGLMQMMLGKKQEAEITVDTRKVAANTLKELGMSGK